MRDGLAGEIVDRCEKRGESFSRAGGSCDEHGARGADCRPGLDLCRSGCGKSPAKPGCHGGVKRIENVHAGVGN